MRILGFFSCQFLVLTVLYNENIKTCVCVCVLCWPAGMSSYRFSSCIALLFWFERERRPTKRHFQQKRKAGIIKLLNESNFHSLGPKEILFFPRETGTSFPFIPTVAISSNKKPLLRSACGLEADTLQFRPLRPIQRFDLVRAKFCLFSLSVILIKRERHQPRVQRLNVTPRAPGSLPN